MLEATEQFKVTGQLRQHRSGSHGQGAAPSAAVAQPSQEDAATEVKDGFVSHLWNEKRFKLGLVKEETGNECPDGWWFGTGTKKTFGGEPAQWPGSALMLGFSKEDATTFIFQEVGKTKGGETVNPRTLPETGGVTVASVPVYSFRTASGGTWVTAIDDGPGPEYYMISGAPTNYFAFLPLEPNSRWPLASGVPPPDGDCSYGMYHMDKKATGEFAYWMDGDYPVYIIEDQLCCASDECEPPTRYKVSLMAEKHRVIQVDIDCGAVISVTCQSVAGEMLAQFELPSHATLGDLRHQVNKVLRPPEELTISLLNLRSGQVLSQSEDAERLTKV